VEPYIVIEDEAAIGVDIETRHFDVPFVSEVKAFDASGAEEGLDIVPDVGAGVFSK
jgi:hypothetical protein